MQQQQQRLTRPAPPPPLDAEAAALLANLQRSRVTNEPEVCFLYLTNAELGAIVEGMLSRIVEEIRNWSVSLLGESPRMKERFPLLCDTNL